MALILVFDYRRILDAIENDPRAEQIDGDYRKSVKFILMSRRPVVGFILRCWGLAYRAISGCAAERWVFAQHAIGNPVNKS
jgi:hypothetical protein